MDYVSLNQCVSEGVAPASQSSKSVVVTANNIVDFVRAKGRSDCAQPYGSGIRHEDEKIAPAISMRILQPCR
jgi:hypothetical protein